MDKNVQIFKNEMFGEVRVAVNETGEPLFCLADLCKVLGLTNASAVKSRLDDDHVQLIDLYALNNNEGVNISDLTGNSITNFVNEDGFYEVLLQSKSPKVKPFRKWVTSDILPSTRMPPEKNIIVIDDIMTTGCTLKAIYDLLPMKNCFFIVGIKNS
jgi:prophage antirepressor-like protein